MQTQNYKFTEKHQWILVTMIIILVFAFSIITNAQVSINTDGSDADTTAMLDIKSSSKGLLIPRLTGNQIANMLGPGNGLLVFNTDDGKFYVYRSISANWNEIPLGINTISPNTWTCGSAFVDSRDEQSYSTVQIGTQCWMAEDLNIGIMTEGINDQTDNGTIEKYCYSNAESNCDEYGGFYQWDEMMEYETIEGVQGICPSDWHIPTRIEWQTLSDALGGNSVSGIQLKSTSSWFSEGNGNNASGFNALPSGYRDTDGSFTNITKYSTIWSSTQQSGAVAYNWYLTYADNGFHENSSWKSYGLSVRCIKD